MCVCVYVCVCVYIYIHTHTYIHTYIQVKVQGTLIHSSGQCDKCITVPHLSIPKAYTYLVHK